MPREAEHLLLARHGRAEHNELKYFMNEEMFHHLPQELLERHAEEHPLTLEGIEQARFLGRWLAAHLIEDEGISLDNYFVSPLTRTEQTAGYAGREIEAAHPNIDINWIRDRNLRETQRGDLERLRRVPGFSESQRPDILPTSPLYRRVDGGESIIETVDRWKTFRSQREAQLRGAASLLVVHGFFMGAVELDLEGTGLSDEDAHELFFRRSPGNGNVVHYTNVEPETGEVADELRWVRAIMPYETSKGFQFDWREIARPMVASSAELVAAHESTERLLPDREALAAS